MVNFPPRQIGPFMSEVLVLGALDEERGVVLLRPDRGSRAGRADRLSRAGYGPGATPTINRPRGWPSTSIT